MTMEHGHVAQAQAPLGGTLRMPAAPPPPPMRGLPESLTTPTSPGPALQCRRMTLPFGAHTPLRRTLRQPERVNLGRAG